MKTYWDASAIINAVSEEVSARLDAGQHVTRIHTFCEFFSTMTGRGVEVIDHGGLPARVVFSPSDCALWLREFAANVEIQNLSKDQALNALDDAQRLGVQGARIYDYFHAVAAIIATADELITRNTKHFEGLTANTKLAWS